tara:strand:+ start:347 stop:529 length:183 start_codon:yes stop_codon:yes gene_type:complete
MSKKSLFESLQERNNQTNTTLNKDKFNELVNEISQPKKQPTELKNNAEESFFTYPEKKEK